MEDIKKWRADYVQIKESAKHAEARKRVADELAENEKIATLDDIEKFREQNRRKTKLEIMREGILAQ